jgi:hypothetical protein
LRARLRGATPRALRPQVLSCLCYTLAIFNRDFQQLAQIIDIIAEARARRAAAPPLAPYLSSRASRPRTAAAGPSPPWQPRNPTRAPPARRAQVVFLATSGCMTAQVDHEMAHRAGLLGDVALEQPGEKVFFTGEVESPIPRGPVVVTGTVVEKQ